MRGDGPQITKKAVRLWKYFGARRCTLAWRHYLCEAFRAEGELDRGGREMREGKRGSG